MHGHLNIKYRDLSNKLITSVHYVLIISEFFKGYTVAELVEALRYKPEGRGFDSR
jgi:hypothetical protein